MSIILGVSTVGGVHAVALRKVLYEDTMGARTHPARGTCIYTTPATAELINAPPPVFESHHHTVRQHMRLASKVESS
ncbi:hypothetical protein BD626DRAFT_516958 [Schizophyllum amplum]|uniref:Uncharacterized protein n=1 Tax=Schizophyllum amplum TaxID=97359 RepID=A0A550BWP0_9AGAR|nr:hypothetical protein BD626DRAFT_516958 [Auriculariopsis ampla]